MKDIVKEGFSLIPARLETVGMENPDAVSIPALCSMSVGEREAFGGAVL